MVELLEKKGEGLNLTWGGTDGNHRQRDILPRWKEKLCPFPEDRLYSLHGDRLLAERAGILSEAELPEALWAGMHQRTAQYPDP